MPPYALGLLMLLHRHLVNSFLLLYISHHLTKPDWWIVRLFPLFILWKWKCYHSVVSDSCNPMDCSPPGSSVHGISQARILEWVAIPFSRGSSWPRDWTYVSCIAGRFFTVWATRRGCYHFLYCTVSLACLLMHMCTCDFLYTFLHQAPFSTSL